jgi:cell division protein FtsB
MRNNGTATTFGRQWQGWRVTLAVTATVLALAASMPARAQQPQKLPESIVAAARMARERGQTLGKQIRIITNDDLGLQYSVGRVDLAPEPASAAPVEAANPAVAGCDNPEAERLKAELTATREDLEQLRHQLNYQSPSAGIDLQYFKPGNSGFYVGAPARVEKAPPSAAMITEVDLAARVAFLERAVRLACESPEAASIQSKIDALDQELELSQREYDLDSGSYYSQTNFSEDRAGKARLDAQAQRIEELKVEIAELQNELAEVNAEQGVQ